MRRMNGLYDCLKKITDINVAPKDLATMIEASGYVLPRKESTASLKNMVRIGFLELSLNYLCSSHASCTPYDLQYRDTSLKTSPTGRMLIPGRNDTERFEIDKMIAWDERPVMIVCKTSKWHRSGKNQKKGHYVRSTLSPQFYQPRLTSLKKITRKEPGCAVLCLKDIHRDAIGKEEVSRFMDAGGLFVPLPWSTEAYSAYVGQVRNHLG